MDPIVSELSERIRQAGRANARPCVFAAAAPRISTPIAWKVSRSSVSAFRGVVDYEPSELVLTARAGTPLAEIERTLAQGGQMLACEPPYFGPDATLGGCVAAGFSGPRRAYAGAVRDFVLGVRVLDSQGEELRFGGQVMKNVAGFDVSRLLAGSFGTLGVILEVSLKVLPKPEAETTRASGDGSGTGDRDDESLGRRAVADLGNLPYRPATDGPLVRQPARCGCRAPTPGR